jgi:hypothetical protein
VKHKEVDEMTNKGKVMQGAAIREKKEPICQICNDSKTEGSVELYYVNVKCHDKVYSLSDLGLGLFVCADCMMDLKLELTGPFLWFSNCGEQLKLKG